MTIELNLDRSAIPAERDRIAAEARAILDRSTGALSEEDRAAYEEHMADLEALHARDEQLEKIERLAANPAAGERARRDAPAVHRKIDPWNHAERMSDTERAQRALDAVDVPDAAKEAVTRSMGEGLMARYAATMSDPAYSRAFGKLLADPMGGHRSFDAAELAAYQRADALARAMGESGTGGITVPFQLDPAIVLSGNGTASDIRSIARVVQTAAPKWQGLTSTGATAEWKSEGGEVADGSPAIDEPAIDVHAADVFVPFSFELADDMPGLQSELGRVMADAKVIKEAAAFVSGTGTGQPAGVLTGLTATQHVNAATADTIVAADVVDLQNALPARFQPAARFAAALTTINGIASLETTNGALRFPEVANDRLLRKPLAEVSELPTATTTTGGTDAVMVYGDWSKYVIVDHVGARLELIPNLFGSNGRPTGQRGVMLFWRVGAKVTVPNAFRVLMA